MQHNNNEARPPSLRQRVWTGMAWSMLQTSGARLISMAVLLVLARLLGPQEFGIVTAAFVVFGALASIVDLGVGDVLVRRRQDQTDYDSAFWVVSAFALLLATVAVLAAGPIADVLNQPLLPPLLSILAATLPLTALGAVQGARMRAEMKFKPLALRSLVATTLGGGAGIALALGGAGYWSLLVKGLVESVASAVLLWVVCSYRPGRQFSWSRWRELFAGAKHLLGTRLIDIVNQRTDSLIVSARLGAASLGLYSASHRLYAVLMETLFSTVNRVTLPAFAQMSGDRERMQRALLRLIRVTSFFTFPVFAAIGILAQPLVLALLGSEWSDAAPVLTALCLGGLLFSVSHFNAPLLSATGRTELLLRLMLVNAALIVVAVGIGSLWGIVGVALGFALRGYLMLPLGLAYLRRAIGLQPRAWLAALVPALLATAVSSPLLAAAQATWLPSAPAPLRLAVLAALFLLLHAVVAVTLIPARALVVIEELAAWQPGLGRLASPVRRWQAIVWRR